MEPLPAIRRSYERSAAKWTGTVDGVPACILGVEIVSKLTLTGRPWLLGTGAVEDHALPFLRRSRFCLDAMLAIAPELENYVDARNAVSIAWLRWLGFSIDPAEPYGALGRPFHRFHMGL
jgi:hypothetical protein